MFSNITSVFYSSETNATEPPTPAPSPVVTATSVKLEDSKLDLTVEDSKLDQRLAESLKIIDMIGDVKVDGRIPEANTVQQIDTVDDLVLYHFGECDEDSPENVSECRGIIKRVDEDSKVETTVCNSFGFTPEYFSDQPDKVKAVLAPIMSKCTFRDAHEGTMLRVWYNKASSKWMVSSHKRINAYSSRWGSAESHGDMLVTAISTTFNSNRPTVQENFNEWVSTLNTDRIYAVLVRTNTNNRIVCRAGEKPIVYFCGEFSSTTLKYVPNENTSNLPMAPIRTFSTPDEVLSFVNAVDHNVFQGVIGYYMDGDNVKCVKITNHVYNNLANIRGNVPSIKFRYLMIRKDPVSVQFIRKLYPEYIPSFELYEKTLNTVISEIYTNYVKRFIVKVNGIKEYVVMPQEQWFVASELHNLYLSDIVKYKISPELVEQFVDSMPPHKINRLIKSKLERDR